MFRKGELALDDAMIGEDSQAASNGATASSASPVAAAIAGRIFFMNFTNNISKQIAEFIPL